MAADKEYSFNADAIIKELPHFGEKGITELTVTDKAFASNKEKLMQLLNAVQKNAPDLFLSITVNPSCIDRQTVQAFSEIACSLEIPLQGTEKNGALLFDKKPYSSKANLLNDAGIVFGFDMAFGKQKGDTFKAFRERLDFALSLYPNHIDFLQLEEDEGDPAPTGVYSSKDLDFSHGIAFACRTFYSCGRAVPWFNTVLQALKVNGSTFLADFEEWQQCNNCSMESGYIPEDSPHSEIEKMQLLFLQQKFEEKNKLHLLPAVTDLIKLNGAFSRVAAENQESVIETSYNPDDLLSPYSMDIAKFAENVPMEQCGVRIFNNQDCPDYKIL